LSYNVVVINKDEMLFVVDKNNNPLEPKPRSEVHSKGYWHRTAHVWILNFKNQLLCQKRSLLKDSNPGFWEPFFGGHLAPGVEYLDGAIEELNEELGLNIKKDQLKLFKIYKEQGDKPSEFQGVFL
jgi:isopentenyl-diphosphate Delta-isomerase